MVAAIDTSGSQGPQTTRESVIKALYAPYCGSATEANDCTDEHQCLSQNRDDTKRLDPVSDVILDLRQSNAATQDLCCQREAGDGGGDRLAG